MAYLRRSRLRTMGPERLLLAMLSPLSPLERLAIALVLLLAVLAVIRTAFFLVRW